MSKIKSESNSLSSAIENIIKVYGKGAVLKLGDKVVEKIPAISTGCLSLDLALGVGGFPKGRIIEVFGPESSGKTTLCLQTAASVHKNGGIVAIIDAEHALDINYARNLGVNVDNLYISQPENGEMALGIAEEWLKSNAVDLIIVDSVAALTPRAEIDGEIGDSHMGLQARLMSQALRKLAGLINKSGSTVIFTNQLRQKIGVFYGNPETTTGGNALKFYASVRVDIRRTETIKDGGGNIIGNKARIKIVKNKVAPPFKEVEVSIIYGKGIDKLLDIVELAIKYNIIEKSGAWYLFEDKKFQGRDSLIDYFNNNAVIDNIINKILEYGKSI